MLIDSRRDALEIYALAHPDEQLRRDHELDALLQTIVRDPEDEIRGTDLNTLKKILHSIEKMSVHNFTKSSLDPLEASALSVVFKGALLTRIRNLEN